MPTYRKTSGYVEVLGATPEELNGIADRLSLLDPDRQYACARNPAWDGCHRAFDWKRHRFPVGMSSLVPGCPVEWPGPPMDEADGAHPFPLRDDQVALARCLLSRAHGVAIAPTGSGKTAVIGEIVKAAGSTTWCIVYRRSQLARQTHAYLSALLREDVGFVGDGDEGYGRVTVVMAQTVTARMASSAALCGLMATTEGIIIDECHLAGGAQVAAILRRAAKATCRYFYGLTATYPPDDVVDAWKAAHFIGPDPVKVVTPDEVKTASGAPEITVIEVVCKGSGTRYTDWRAEVEREIYTNEARNGLVATAVSEAVAHGAASLITTESKVTHAAEMAKWLDMMDLRYAPFDGDVPVPRRQQLISDVQDGTLDCLLCTTVADYGLDAPDLQVLIDAGTWRSGVLRRQRLGRVRRRKKCAANVGVYVMFRDVNSPRTEAKGRAALASIVAESPGYRIVTVSGEKGLRAAMRAALGKHHSSHVATQRATT